jgi:hypothetical protein
MPLLKLSLPLTLLACTLADKIRNSNFGTLPNQDAICIYRLLKPLLAILDDLEPAHLRRSCCKHTSLAYYSYCQSVVRWKRLFLHYIPNAAELLDVLEMLHRLLLRHILDRFDRMRSGTDIFSTLVAIEFVYEGVPSLKLCESVNKAAVEHLEIYLEHRRLVLISALSTTHSVTKGTTFLKRGKKIVVSGNFAEASEYYPPGPCKNRKDKHGNNGGEEGCPDCLQPPALVVQPAPLQCVQTTPTCLCSTYMCSLPSHVLAFLDIDMDSITEDIRNPEGRIPRTARYLLQRISVVDQLELFAEWFRQAMSISLKTYFDTLALEMRSDDWRTKFGHPAHGKFRIIEKNLEGPIRVGVFIQIAHDLLCRFITSGWPPDSQPDGDQFFHEMNDWMKHSPAGKKVSKQLNETIDELVRNPIKVSIIEREGKTLDILVCTSRWVEVAPTRV